MAVRWFSGFGVLVALGGIASVLDGQTIAGSLFIVASAVFFVGAAIVSELIQLRDSIEPQETGETDSE